MDERHSSTKIGETPRLRCHEKRVSLLESSCLSRSSFGPDSADSGYVTTPHSATSGLYSTLNSSSRIRDSCTPAKGPYRRLRTDPWKSERCTRFRTKLNNLLNSSIESASDVPASRSNRRCSTESRSPLDTNSPSKADLASSSLANEFYELRSRFQERSNTGCPIAPASRSQRSSHPPSPAIPSLSFVASEPVEDDVDMKLVIVSQSTPHESSPTTSKSSPAITSLDNQKLSRLAIADISMTEIKPKRLDFSQRPRFAALHRTRPTPDYTGRPTVDLLAALGEKSNHWRIVSKILSLLSPQDLCSVSMVSKVWRRICSADSRAHPRRLSHVMLRQNTKENLKLIRKSKIEVDLHSSPKTRFARKGHLMEVQNLLQSAANHLSPSSPPVSPSKVKFHSFVKASRTLEPWEHLVRCPKCDFPCHVDGEKNVATCSRQGCSMEFCSSCSARPHSGPCKTPLLATPTKRNKRLVVGSRQSKRNLRRL